MPDDPKKRGKQDRDRVSQQEHEQRYQREKKNRETSERDEAKSRNPGENES
ncbi:MAG TPA: hypothetical protein VGP93_14425 [Polyangiaceae bacterium]|jgi:hypothetical protein|nr:hypothetical protein [Polyangiaceae bacterium]